MTEFVPNFILLIYYKNNSILHSFNFLGHQPSKLWYKLKVLIRDLT